MENNRKQEVIGICLDHFIAHGLANTSTRSLSNALQLQNAGLYYYFSSKDEAVVQCAEEAIRRIEHALMPLALEQINDPDRMMEELQQRADEMALAMRFVVSVVCNERYRQSITPVLQKLLEQHEKYSLLVAQRLGCTTEEIRPYVYMAVTAVSNYMTFGNDLIIAPQMRAFKEKLKEILSRG